MGEINGVNIEAYSIEDSVRLHFNVYVYNVQKGIKIFLDNKS